MGLLARIGAGFADIAGMIWRHVRIGCTTELLQVELALILACVLVDGYRFTEYGLCLTAPFRLTLTGTGALQAAAAVFILFLVAAPLTAGIFRVVISMPMRSGHKHRTALAAHVALCLALAGVAILTWNSRTLAGSKELTSGVIEYRFHPLLAWLLDLSAYAVGKITAAKATLSAATITAALAFLRVYVLRTQQPPEIVKDYIKASELADLDRRFVPTAAPVRLNFSAPGNWSYVPMIGDRMETLVREYRRNFPGTREAGKHLENFRLHCFELVREVLEVPAFAHGLQIEIFKTEGRALEVALDRFGPANNLILSPFESQVAREAARWHCSGSQAPFAWISEDTISGARFEMDRMLDEFARLLRMDRVNVLVIGEVNPVTGMTLPIRELAAKLRDRFSAHQLKIVVDSSHSAGNGGKLRFLDSADAYLFKAHKWLMAAEPCEILLTKDNVERSPYDAWTVDKPNRSDDVRMIAGLIASLELVKANGFEFFWNRSRMLQETFLERARKKGFEVVGESESSNGVYPERTLVSCVRPQKGAKWRMDFIDIIDRSRLGIRVNNPSEPGLASVTVSFPYYLSFWHLNELLSALSSATEVWGGVAAGAKA